jgi:hypothetical protein
MQGGWKDTFMDNVWSWGSPLGLGAFVLAVGATILMLAWAVYRLSTIPTPVETKETRKRR